MSTYGFKNNKSKEEIYAKDEVYSKEASDGKYICLDNIAVITGTVTIAADTTETINIDYPDGFDMDNSMVISCGLKIIENRGYNFTGQYIDSGSLLQNAYLRYLNLNSETITLIIKNHATSDSKTISYKILLLKNNN